MAEQDKTKDVQLSEDELKEVAGGTDVHKRRLEHLDNQSKSVDDIQKTRLDQLGNSTK
ncbi:MAG: hypothetical protein AAGC93_12500 [Cyanobacteria bacterium P01_F01_bin.53]